MLLQDSVAPHDTASPIASQFLLTISLEVLEALEAAVMATRIYSNNKYLLERLLSACDSILELCLCRRQQPPQHPQSPPPQPSSSLLLVFPPWSQGSEEPWDPLVRQWSLDSTPEPFPEPIAEPDEPQHAVSGKEILVLLLALGLWLCVLILRDMMEAGPLPSTKIHPQSHPQVETQYTRPTIRSLDFPLAHCTSHIQGAQRNAGARVSMQLTNIFRTAQGLPAEVIFDTGASMSIADKSWLLKHCPGCQPKTLHRPLQAKGVSGASSWLTEFVDVDLVFNAQTRDGPVDLRLAATVVLFENSNANMLLGMDLAYLHKIDVDQRRQKLIFREAKDAEVDFRLYVW